VFNVLRDYEREVRWRPGMLSAEWAMRGAKLGISNEDFGRAFNSLFERGLTDSGDGGKWFTRCDEYDEGA
jgi:hypothetical protein